MKIFTATTALLATWLLSVNAGPCPSLDANKKTAKALLDDVFNKKDVSAVDKYTDGIYLQHNPAVPDGPQSLKNFASTFTNATRAEFGAILAEGDLVWVNARYVDVPGLPKSAVAVDVFRFDASGKIAEHWDVLQTEVPASETASGRPMFPITSSVTTPMAPTACGDSCELSDPRTDANKKTAKALLDDVFNKKDISAVDKYTDGIYLQHNPAVPDGPQSLKSFAATFTNETKAEFGAIAAEGDLVWINTRYVGVHGFPTSVAVDVFRFDVNGKIAEHWDILQAEVPADKTASGRPMFPIQA